MTNKYLEKIALVRAGVGGLVGMGASNSGDGLGGGLVGAAGGHYGGMAGARLGNVVAGPGGALVGLGAGAIMGGYTGGRVYSKAKSALKKKPEDHEKKAFDNKYLEKIALLDHAVSGVMGAAASKPGDRVGGAVTGVVGGELGSRIGAAATSRLGMGAFLAGAIGGRIAGSYGGGMAYSKAKKAIKGDKKD